MENFDGVSCIHGEIYNYCEKCAIIIGARLTQVFEPKNETAQERRERYIRLNPWFVEFEAKYNKFREEHGPLTDEV